MNGLFIRGRLLPVFSLLMSDSISTSFIDAATNQNNTTSYLPRMISLPANNTRYSLWRTLTANSNKYNRRLSSAGLFLEASS